jgi:ankyrin repeat protein
MTTIKALDKSEILDSVCQLVDKQKTLYDMLIWAIHEDSLVLAEKLIRLGVDVCQNNNYALVRAIQYFRYDIAQLLYDNGASLYNEWSDCLLRAAMYKDVQLAKFLLQDRRYHKDIDKVFMFNVSEEMVTLLLQTKYQVDGDIYCKLKNMI